MNRQRIIEKILGLKNLIQELEREIAGSEEGISDVDIYKRTLAAVAMVFDVNQEVITGKSKWQEVVRARWAVILYLRQEEHFSLDHIGRLMRPETRPIGHGTIRFGHDKAAGLLKDDQVFAERYGAVVQMLKENAA